MTVRCTTLAPQLHTLPFRRTPRVRGVLARSDPHSLPFTQLHLCKDTACPSKTFPTSPDPCVSPPLAARPFDKYHEPDTMPCHDAARPRRTLRWQPFLSICCSAATPLTLCCRTLTSEKKDATQKDMSRGPRLPNSSGSSCGPTRRSQKIITQMLHLQRRRRQLPHDSCHVRYARKGTAVQPAAAAFARAVALRLTPNTARLHAAVGAYVSRACKSPSRTSNGRFRPVDKAGGLLPRVGQVAWYRTRPQTADPFQPCSSQTFAVPPTAHPASAQAPARAE